MKSGLLICFIITLLVTSTFSSALAEEPFSKNAPPIQMLTRTFPDLFFLLPIGRGFALTFINKQEVPIKDCRITFNSKYAASLHQLKRQNPETRYNFPPTSDIPPKSTLTFEFSHDVSNGWEFLDEMGDKYLCRWGPPKTITVESSNFARTTWLLSEKTTQGKRTYILEGE